MISDIPVDESLFFNNEQASVKSQITTFASSSLYFDVESWFSLEYVTLKKISLSTYLDNSVSGHFAIFSPSVILPS